MRPSPLPAASPTPCSTVPSTISNGPAGKTKQKGIHAKVDAFPELNKFAAEEVCRGLQAKAIEGDVFGGAKYKPLQQDQRREVAALRAQGEHIDIAHVKTARDVLALAQAFAN